MAGVQTGQGRVMPTGKAMLIAAFVASLPFLSPAVHAAKAKNDALIDRMTDQLVEMMPIDRIFDDAEIQRDMFDDSRLDKAQASCVLREMSAQRYRAIRRRDVELYAIRHPQQVVYDLALLESGAGPIMAKLMRDAFEQQKIERAAKADADTSEAEAGTSSEDAPVEDAPGEDVASRPNPADAIMDTASASEVLAMMIFMGDPNHEELRVLTGFGGHPSAALLGPGFPFTGLGDSMRRQPFDMIGLTMMKMLLGAASDCKVSPKVLLDKAR